MELQQKSHCVGHLGPFNLELTEVLVGTGGPPKVSITALLHGDEFGGILALDHLVRGLQGQEFKGTLRLVPIANPLAGLFRVRVSPYDHVDLNRIGIGDSKGGLSERLARKLFEVVQDSSLVIHLHEFESRSPLTCVITNSGSQAIQERVLRAAVVFQPDAIWSLRSLTIAGSYSVRSFDHATTGECIASLAVEFSRSDLIPETQYEAFVTGIRRILSDCGVIEGAPSFGDLKLPRVLSKKSFSTMRMAVWMPLCEVLSPVIVGDTVGELAPLPVFGSPSREFATEGGVIFNIRPYEVVRPNDILYSVGRQDEEVEEKCDRLLSDLQAASK